MSDFRVENLRVVETPTATRVRRRRKRDFIIVHRWQSDRLDQAVHAATERVFRYVLFRRFRATGRMLKLGNTALRERRVGRKAKRAALLELEGLGLIRVYRRPRRSPEIEVLDEGGGT